MEINNLTITDQAVFTDPILFNKLYNTNEVFSDEEISRLFHQLFCYDLNNHNSEEILSDLLRSLFKPQIVVYNENSVNIIGPYYPIELLKDKATLLDWLKNNKGITAISEVKIIAPLCPVKGIDPTIDFTDFTECYNVSEIKIK